MRILFTTLVLLISGLLLAQSPALIPYQAIARNASGEPIANNTINVRFTMHHGSAGGPLVWQELQTLSTSALGLFTAQLGSSVPFSAVNWSNGEKFMQVEIDLGNGYIDIGTQQLLSVPYALHAGSVRLDVSTTGDTLFVGDGSFVIIPGISEANSLSTGTTLHTCGAPNIHNPNLTYGTMTDQEGNVYKTIVIGTQEWMAENLNSSIYRNGDAIPTNLDSITWSSTVNGAWSYYLNDPSYACPFGKLYNWYTCVDIRDLCPLGWHIPSDEEWTVLGDFLGGFEFAGSRLKSVGSIESGNGIWTNSIYDSQTQSNIDATNESGFSAIPGGLCMQSYFGDIGAMGWWWSSSVIQEIGFDFPLNLYLNYFDGYFLRSYTDFSRNTGFSVRCLKD